MGVFLIAIASVFSEKDNFHQVKLDHGKGYAICTGSESYYTPDPDNCHNFFGCVYDEHNDFFHVYKFECQTGLAYDPNTHSCQDEMSVDRCWYACSEDWTLFQESCYLFDKNTQHNTFMDAKQACVDLGGYLVEIETKEEDDFIINTVTEMANSKCENTDYWLGAEDLDNDGIWTWTTSGNPVVYSNWWSNPGSLKSNCGQLLRKGSTQPSCLDSFFWTLAAAGKDCVKGNDSDNGIICERTPDSFLPPSP